MNLLTYKKFYWILLINLAMLTIMPQNKAFSQADQEDDWRKQEESDIKFPYYKDKYEDTLDLPFEKVWEAAVLTIEDINCMIITKNPRQGDDGLYRGTIQSDFCVFAQADTVLKNMKYYSIEMPFIRGGVWQNARFQYKYVIKELENGMCSVRMIGEISGFENHVTSKVHFWKSNGFKEFQMLERLKMKLGLPHKFQENL